MSLVSFVDETGRVTSVPVLNDVTFRTFARVVLQKPASIFFSPQGIVFPEDGNVAALALPSRTVHYISNKKDFGEDQRSSRHVAMDDVPFLHLPENRDALRWISRGLDNPEHCIHPTYLTLDQEVRASFSSPLEVEVVREDGETTRSNVWTWIESLHPAALRIKCNVTHSSDAFEWLSSLDGNIHICRRNDEGSTSSIKKQRCS